ncbi:WXG100 family type VII secretion target [Actinophytocola sp.]|uniref:WXG100 family type VII secretion target n=1 Tax=Actinophytocola sp. TaxID=1872138 RepID=UPI002D698DCC|nr:WXG100 family type VII secretion target [Actinophytocola sp.]HYQ64822.1 WXG100 family type VII secretion target [Actinophytocola sp.]
MTIEVTQSPDGKDIEGQITTQLAYLSRLARQLGVNDPVEEYFAPVVGRWSDMHAEAERWRTVGEGVEQVTGALNKPLGKLDAAWEGEAAQSFIGYMQQVGLAGNDLADAMSAMAEVLDQTADSIREIVVELAGVMAETAESASEAMSLPVQGDARTREYLDLMRRPTKELFEAVRQVLEAFVQLCEGAEGDGAFGGVTMAHTYPAEDWSYVVPSTPGAPAPGDTGVPVDTGTDAAALGGGLGDFGGGLGGGGFGGGAAAAAAMDSPLAPGNSTVAGEQAPHSTAAPGGAAAAASAGASKGGTGSGMMPMSPMMGGQGQGQGDQTHKSRARVVGNPQDIFGKPERASTPVIGADD